MYTLILLICIAIFTICIIGLIKWENDLVGDAVGITAIAVAIIIGLIIIGFGIAVFDTYSKYAELMTIDRQIQVYKEQNKQIENKVSTTVDKYLEYENKTYSNLKFDSKIALATVYPDLKGNELIQEQIKLYNKNNDKITKCRIEKTKGKYYRKMLIPFS